jgi:DsbC/DsbD-like thiol-disulfide interchange protein
MKGQVPRAKGLACAALVLMAVPAAAQEIRLGDARPAVRQRVELLTDAVAVKAGREQVVELRFRVEPGFHINSHAPKDELLVPTVLRLDPSGVDVRGVEYPAGSAFRLGDGSTLDVYQGEFRVAVRLTAHAGQSTLTGALRYQACDNAACFPPRTLVVRVAMTGQ